MTKKVIKDYKLFGIVIFLLVIDIIILVSWQLFDPLHIVQKQYDVNAFRFSIRLKLFVNF